jgi:Arc/MetJ-type ribon-helix-helix transcriptional regulator
LQKVTYSLPTHLIDEVREVVRNGAARSYSAFVERALTEGVLRARERELAEAFANAGSDPAFLDDVERTLREFGALDDGLERPE